MLVVFSHVLAFATLFLGAVFDLKTTEVPDAVSLTGIIGGVILHSAASLAGPADVSTLMSFSTMIGEPLSWFSALGEPLIWSLGVGIIFSVYGWTLYFLGMWGGADAFAMGVLGFGAPYAVGSIGFVHAVDLFVNILLTGFVYTLVFAFYRAYKEGGILKATYKRLKAKEKRVAVEIFLATLLSAVGVFTGRFDGLIYFCLLVGVIVLYRFLLVVQERSLVEEVEASELEGGEVVESDQLDGRIKGVTEKEVQELEGKVSVKEGVRFIPVFPVALVLTETTSLGVRWLVFLLN